MTSGFSTSAGLPGRFELGSETWRDEAVAFLNRQLGKVSKNLFRDDIPQSVSGIDPTPFSMCETLHNAPPHLGLDGNVSCFSLYFDGESFRADDQPNPKADVKITGEYQAGLYMSQIVGFAEPGRLSSATNMLSHTFGSDAFRSEGTFPNPDAQELIVKLHDFLGRRTVENPDLAHRARQLGVVDHIRALEEDGYTIVERMLPDDYTDALREEILKHSSVMPTNSVSGLLQHGRLFEDLAQHPVAMTLVDATVGRGALLGYFLGSSRGPGKGIIAMHADYDHTPDPFPEWALTTNCLYALDDWDSDKAGPTWVIPGSHKKRRQPNENDDQTGGIPVVMPKGSMLVMTSGIWHWQGDRADPGTRVTINAYYFRNLLRPHAPITVDDKLLYRNPPRLGEMLGLDDWFEKADFKGKDFARLRHMSGLSKFNDERKRELLTQT